MQFYMKNCMAVLLLVPVSQEMAQQLVLLILLRIQAILMEQIKMDSITVNTDNDMIKKNLACV